MTPGYLLPAEHILPAGRIAPAGQAQSWALSTTQPPGAITTDQYGDWTDANGALIYNSAGQYLVSYPPGQPPTGGGAPSGGNTALYNTVGSALGTTGATIASVVQSNNSVQIAQLQSQTQQQIAALQASAMQAQQQGNAALAQQNLQNAAALQQFNAMLLSQIRPPNTALYILAGIVGLIVIGGVVYAVTAKESGRTETARQNPRRRARYHGAA